jgi:GT2 family glycosyltransferase
MIKEIVLFRTHIRKVVEIQTDNLLDFSIVIPTANRPDLLRVTLGSIRRQTRQPKRIVVVDASKDDLTAEIVKCISSEIHVERHATSTVSAATQRNIGAAFVETPLIAFIDDDILLEPDVCERICAVFEADPTRSTGGVAARMAGHTHPVPRKFLWWYYRLQAGFSDPTYGARLFGPAINCFPTYREPGPLIRADWLNSACVFYRTNVFNAQKFPNFEGYSYMEDVHLSARIARSHRLYFHAEAICEHCDGASASPRDLFKIGMMRSRNQRIVARDVLNLRGPSLELKLMIHRVFASIAIVRRMDKGWHRELLGTWR